MKEALTFTYELLKFTIISVPLACLVYLIAVSLSKIKQLCGTK
jgi:hypothetical protein